ncbi:hypothetical protein C1H46_005694 [Malus baccata]|uniref:Uncharacterized protein n=1 Tax=Malus baccata TaxID=106549 RepID=A0A540NDX5_MALBA|nr:hypothetical protein C1H46_005694 [Malus baccata]
MLSGRKNCCEILPVLARRCNPTSALPLPSSNICRSSAGFRILDYMLFYSMNYGEFIPS